MPPTHPPAVDWLSYVKENGNANGVEFDLRQLRAGDVLRVVTDHTTYVFRMLSAQGAILQTGRDDRPSGKVRIMGCTFGQSSSIKPDHLFCGGNLKFVCDEGRMTHSTTRIRAIQWLRAAARKEEMNHPEHKERKTGNRDGLFSAFLAFFVVSFIELIMNPRGHRAGFFGQD